MTIIYCSDQAFFSYMAVSLVSLFENNKGVDELAVYCILLDVKEEDKKQLESLSHKYGRNIKFIDALPYCDKYRFWPKEKDGKYIRLLLSEILSEDKVLYIDCDTIITTELDELWNVELKAYWIAAVQDIALESHKAEANISKLEPYFNSGVMLINLDAWRKEARLIDAFAAAYIHTSSYRHNDQRVLNNVCNGHVLFVPPKYNAVGWYSLFIKHQFEKLMDGNLLYNEKEVRDAMHSPVILHFAGAPTKRPWASYCEHPFKGIFYDYEKLSPIRVKYIDAGIKEIVFSIIRRIIPFSLYVIIYRKRHG